MNKGRNYVKFDFDNIKFTELWDLKIQNLKDVLLEYIKINNYYIYDKIYIDNILNFYAATVKLTSLNEIYILLLFVYPYEDFDKYTFELNKLLDYVKENTRFDKISLCYQITKNKIKPSSDQNTYYISGLEMDTPEICENIMDYKIYISPNSFTQSNYDAMLQLFSLINKITIENKSDFLHYYGRGMTPISHVLHKNFKKIFGYSSCPISYNDGLKSIQTNKIENIELVLDKNKEIFFENINKDKNQTIIISASRNGFHKLDKVIKCKFNKFIYIACNMKSFIKEIKDLPITFEILGEIDMFPGTEYKEIILDIFLNQT